MRPILADLLNEAYGLSLSTHGLRQRNYVISAPLILFGQDCPLLIMRWRRK